MSCCLKIIEICYVLGEHITDMNLFFDFTNEILDLIELNNESYDIYELIFKIKTLYLLGVAPVFSKCVSCGKKENLKGFAFNNGGMKCSDCIKLDDFIYPSETIKEIKNIYLIKLDQLNLLIKEKQLKYDYSKINRFLELYYEQYLGFISKVNKVLN